MISRCRAIRCPRPAGTAATALTALVTSPVADRAGHVHAVDGDRRARPGRCPPRSPGSPRGAATAAGSSTSTPAARAATRSAPGTWRRCPGSAGRARGPTPARRWTCRTRTGRRRRSTRHSVTLAMLPAHAAIRPPRSAWVSRATASGRTVSSATPTGRPGECSMPMSSMLTPASPAAWNSRASSPGRSGMTTWTTALSRRGLCRACPGSAPPRRRPSLQQAASTLHRGVVGACGGAPVSASASATAARSAATRASTSATGAALAARICVHSPVSPAAILVTSRRPWPARAERAVRRRRPAGPPWPRPPRAARARPAPPSGRARPRRPAPARRGRQRTRAVTAATASGRGRRPGADHPRAAEEQVGPGGGRARSAPGRTAGARARTQARSQPSSRACGSGSAFTLATSVYQRASAGGLGGRERRGDGGGRDGEHRQVGPRRHPAPAAAVRWRRRRRASWPRSAAPSGSGSTVPAPRSAASRAAARVVVGQPDGHAAARAGPARSRSRSGRSRYTTALPSAARPVHRSPPGRRRHWAMSSRRAAAPRRYTCCSAARGLPVSTCISSRTTRGRAPGTSISLRAQQRHVLEPDLAGGQGGELGGEVGGGGENDADHIVGDQVVARHDLGDQLGRSPSRMASRSFASIWTAPRIALTATDCLLRPVAAARRCRRWPAGYRPRLHADGRVQLADLARWSARGWSRAQRAQPDRADAGCGPGG